jgi:hypothetical protein
MRSLTRFTCLAASLLLIALYIVAPTLAHSAEEHETSNSNEPSAVVTLTEANFDELTSSGSWLLEFYGQSEQE